MESSSNQENLSLESGLTDTAKKPEPTVSSHQWPQPLVESLDDPDWPQFTGSDDEIRKWVLEHKKLMMRTVTWNLCAKPPPAKEILQSKLLPKKFHVIIIGTEECERSIAQSALLPSKRNWENYLCEALGENYVALRAHTLQAIHIMCFVHRSIANLCSIATSAAVACGAGNTLGNKGAVSVFLKICGTKILVVNAHLSAHQHAERKRNAEFRKISTQLPLLLEQKDGGTISAAAPVPTGDASPQAIPKAASSNDLPKMEQAQAQSPPTPGEKTMTTTIINEGHVPVTPASVKASHQEGIPNTHEDVADAAVVPKSTTEAPAFVSVALVVDEHEPDEDDEAEGDLMDTSSPTPGNTQPLVSNDSFLTSNNNNVQSGASDGTMTSKTINNFADVVIFMGDLNYRINGNRSIVDKLLAGNMYEVLINNDQLKNNMRQKLVLENFTEPPLHFRPTYKFDRGTDIYDSGPKSRIPSWTDRILYKETEHVTCLAYNSEMSISTSDHKPVYASFLIGLNTFVQLDANQQVVMTNPTDLKFTSESQVCTIS